MTTVGAVLKGIVAGKSVQTLERQAADGELGILKVSAVTWGEFRAYENKGMPSDYDPGDCPRPMDGDILISRANTRELVGAPVMVQGNFPNLLLSDKLLKLIPDDKLVDSRFLLRALRSDEATSHFFKRAGGSSGSMTNITQSDIRAAPIPLPPLPEQRRIAAILDKADTLQTKRREALVQLDRLARSMFEEAVALAKNSGSITARSLSDEYWFQEGPGVRKWQFTTGGVKLLNVGNIEKSGQINLSRTNRHVSIEEANGKYSHFLCDAGDLVIASSGISIEEDGLLATRGAFIEGAHLPLCMNTSTIRFKARGGPSLEFLRAWLSSYEFRSQITKLVTGSAQLNFGPSHLRELQITVPSLDIQEKVTSSLKAISRHRADVENALEYMNNLFVALQHRAFRGEL